MNPPHLVLPGLEDLTLLLLHGRGEEEGSLLPLARTLHPMAHLLSPQGQSLEEGVPRFFRQHREGVLDLEDLKAKGLATLGVEAPGHHAFLRPLVALGYSNGANMALGLLFHHPHLLDGAILLRPMEPFGKPYPPLEGRPVPFLLGAQDLLVPPGTAEVLGERLEWARARAEGHLLLAGHALTPEDLALARG